MIELNELLTVGVVCVLLCTTVLVEDYPSIPSHVRPTNEELLATGHKKAKLRAHSDMCWNHACNDWALSFAPEFDIMVEAKNKNLANQQLYDQYRQNILPYCHK